MNAAIYARVSTTEQAQEGQSITAQKRLLHQYAVQQGYDVTEEFVDEGASARTADRPEFQRMISLAKNKPRPFDVILVHKFDRFARNREDSIVYKNLLRRECDIEVISITEPTDDSPVSKLMEGILEIMAEFYSLNLAQEVQKGMKEAASQAKVLGMIPYGYRAGEDGKLEIVPEEAEVVKYIFDQYVNTSKGMRSVAFELRDQGAELFGDAALRLKWSQPGIRVILRNPIYTGDYTWGRQDVSKNRRVRAKEEWIVVPNAHPPIVGREIWTKAQQIIDSKTTLNTTSQDYLLKGLTRCMDCGGAMGQFSHKWSRKDGTRMTRRMLRCNRYQHSGTCYFNNVSMEEMEGSLFEYIEQFLEGEIDYGDVIVATSDENESGRRITQLERQLKSLPEKFERQMKAYEADIIGIEELKQFRSRLQEEEAKIKDELSVLSDVEGQAQINIEKLKTRLRTAVKTASNTRAPLHERKKALASVLDHVAYSKNRGLLEVVFR